MHATKAPQRNQLTPRQMQILRAIDASLASRCYSPTIAELAGELGISRSTAFEHIAELRKKGLLRASPGRARSLQPTSRAQKLLSSIHTGSSQNQAPRTPRHINTAGRRGCGRLTPPGSREQRPHIVGVVFRNRRRYVRPSGKGRQYDRRRYPRRRLCRLPSTLHGGKRTARCRDSR